MKFYCNPVEIIKIENWSSISTRNSLCVAQTKQIFNDVSLKDRSCHLTCSMITDVLRNFAKFTGKHLCQKFFFNKKILTSRMQQSNQRGCCKNFRVIMKTYILIPSYTFHAWNLKLPQNVLIKALIKKQQANFMEQKCSPKPYETINYSLAF